MTLLCQAHLIHSPVSATPTLLPFVILLPGVGRPKEVVLKHKEDWTEAVTRMVKGLLDSINKLSKSKAQVYLQDAWTNVYLGLDLDNVEQHLASDGVRFFITPREQAFAEAILRIHWYSIF